MRKELMEEHEQNIKIENVKSPELVVKINKVTVNALINTGSAVNALSESWHYNNKSMLGKHEILSVNNTTIISAMGKRSKHVRKQIFCKISINDSLSFDCVFLIVPGLVRECILGMIFLKQTGSIINIKNNKIQLKIELKAIGDEESCEVPLMVQEDVSSIEEGIGKKIDEIEEADITMRSQLDRLLYHYKEVFDERPGRIKGYKHYFHVNDNTPYLQKGCPIPIKYQKAVQTEIRRMLEYGIIERAQSPYINPLVTVIKRDGKVCLCLDARKINSVTTPDYEGPPPINEILAR